VVITCPIRFRQDWIITDHAASFFFAEGVKWTSLTEVRLNDATGKPAGSIDVVLVAYDDAGKVVDFGALEIQAVYISGNVREPFEYYISSRKRLVPQLVYKGGILHSWNKKIAVALNRTFFATLPTLKQVPKDQADIAWLVYDLKIHADDNHKPGRYYLTKVDEIFTDFESALLSITTPLPGQIGDFIKLLQEKLDEHLENPPTNQTMERPF